MITLEELQRLAQGHLLGDGPLPPALAAALVAPATERWAIYVEAYRLRLVEALATQFPALAARAGRAAFDASARAFLAGHPSTVRSLRDYGGALPTFLAAADASDEGQLRAELAAFEWQLAAAFDAAAAMPCTVETLATLAPDAWPGLTFAAVPSLRRLTTTTNAVAAWREARAALETDPAPGPLLAPAAARIQTQEWLIVRPSLDTEFRSLETHEATALDRLLAGASFAQLCAAVAERAGDAAPVVAATWLKGWITAGLLVRR